MDLHSEEQVEKALKKNKDYIGEKYHIHNMCIYIYTYLFYRIIRRVNISYVMASDLSVIL